MARPPPVLLPAGGGAGDERAADGRHPGLRGWGGTTAPLRSLADALSLFSLLQVPPVREQTQRQTSHHPPARSVGPTYAAAPALHVPGRDIHQSGGPRTSHRDS